MNYSQHALVNIITASILSIFFYTQHSHLFSLVEFYLGNFSLKDYWLGALVCTFLITSDLDSDTSIPTKLWGPFKSIWYPFKHRNVLHHVFWGPFILISVVGVPMYYGGHELAGWTIVGMICMIESHILTDKVF